LFAGYFFPVVFLSGLHILDAGSDGQKSNTYLPFNKKSRNDIFSFILQGDPSG